MNRNTLRARVQFSFKGETHALDELIDLDTLRVEAGEMPDMHRLLARRAGIDPISYLYEVLESHDLEFPQATGLAANYCHEGRFDWRGFDRARSEEGDWARILAIVQDTLAPRDLEANPALKAALMAAYQAGKASAR
ncbi:MAG: hypothetical protein FNT29_06485 [Halothiobacillaceae bacterium]|nr:MAG: hypothetical protein FNT29_06485 [Halothiobacillaceae bacterium]